MASSLPVSEEEMAHTLAKHFRSERARKDVERLCATAFAGRRIGTAGHDQAKIWLIERLRQIGLDVTTASFRLETPVLDLYALPTLTLLDERGRVERAFVHRVEFSEHPRSADAPDPVPGIARRAQGESEDLDGAWVILDAVPQGVAFTTFSDQAARRGAVGILTPQFAGRDGYLVKRIGARSTSALPVIAVRPNVLALLDYRRISASAPVRALQAEGGHVLGQLAGSDGSLAHTPLLVSAHYNGVGDDVSVEVGGHRIPCATDNAAGVAVVLEVARIVAAQRKHPRRPIIFAVLDGEEVDAQGSRAYARSLKEQGVVPMALNLDGAARVNDAMWVEAGPGSDTLLSLLDQAGRWLNLPLVLGQVSSDNRRFASSGFPAVGLSVGLAGMHTPADVPEQVQPEAMRRAGALLVATVWLLAYMR